MIIAASSTAKDWVRVYTTVRYLVVQFNASLKPSVAFGNVPSPELQFAEMPARYRPLDSPDAALWIGGGDP